MIGRLVRFFIACVALIALLLAVPRTSVSVMTWIFPEVVFWYDTPDPEVLLAIDDGPNPDTTLAILDALDQAEAKAMFFVLGEKAAAYPELVRAIADRGHSVSAHMYKDEVTVFRNGLEVAHDLDRTLAAIPEDIPVPYVRPGYGVPSPALIDAAKEADLGVLVGDIVPMDAWGIPSQVYRTYLRFVTRPGSILTFHDRPDIGAASAELLPTVISDLRADGYVVLSWSDLRPAP